MKHKTNRIKNGYVILLGLLLAVGISLQTVAAAPAVVVPMQVQQENLISLKIPQFDNTMGVESMSLFNEQFRQVVLQRLREFEPVAFETWKTPHMPVEVKKAMVFTADYEVFRSDERIVSLTQRIYQFTGGAHGMSWQVGQTIDLTNARHLQLSDLFVPGKYYAERLSRLVNEAGAARKLPMWDFKGIGEDSAFYLTDEGIVLFFQPYEIAPYSEGIVRMLFPYSRVADILRPEILR